MDADVEGLSSDQPYGWKVGGKTNRESSSAPRRCAGSSYCG